MSAAPDSRTVSLEIPPKADYVVLARLALSAVCRLTPLHAEDVADLKLAVSETAGSSIGEGKSEPLAFDFCLHDDRLELHLTPAQPPRAAAGEDDDTALSRALVEATVDECRYDPDAVRLVKYLDADSDAQSDQ